jgi:hypothetical protein
MQVEWIFISDYTEAEVRRVVPRSSGIYLLWVKLKEGNKWRCFYVGQVSDLEARLLHHLTNDEENTCIRKQVASFVCGCEYARVDRQTDRDGAEKFL